MTPILLPADFGIDAAIAIRQDLLPRVRQSEPLLLDGSGVARVHGAGVQLLCALFHERGQLRLATVWSGASQPLRAAAQVLGLADLFAFPAEDCAGVCSDPTTHPEISA